MNCEACDSSLSDSAKFCDQCGHRVGEPVTSRMEGIREYAKEVSEEGKVVLAEIGDKTKRGLKSDIGKSMVVWGAAGAVAGVVLPFVGPALIGALGAGYGALKKL